MSSIENDRLPILWMDLEMTGLDPTKETILEIAAIVTNNNLEIIEEGPEIVVKHDPANFSLMDSWCQKQHSKSGLWKKATESHITIAEAEKTMTRFVSKYFNKKDKALIAGNSIWQDRRFLIAYMPDLEEYLHYRMVDVSSLKILCKRWHPKINIPKKKENHRAMDDIKESIDELKFYRSVIFKESNPEKKL